MSTTQPESFDSGYDADELGQYRSLSTSAVIALLLGLCSALAFASPLLLVVPAAAVAVALLALRGIAASDGNLTGGKLARCGLALAILFAVAAYSRVRLRDTLLQRQAQQVGERWLSLAAENRSEKMLELMTKDAASKLTPGEDAGTVMPFFSNVLTTALLRHDPLVVALSDLDGPQGVDLDLKQSRVDISDRTTLAALSYTVRDADANEQECLLVLKRFSASDNNTIWLVDSWSLE